jgi:hypothetical protein
MHKVGAARLERSSFWVTEPAKLPKKAERKAELLPK